MIGAVLTADDRRMLLVQLGPRRSRLAGERFLDEVDRILGAARLMRPHQRDAGDVRDRMHRLRARALDMAHELEGLDRPLLSLLQAARRDLAWPGGLVDVIARLEEDLQVLEIAARQLEQASVRQRGERDRDARRGALRERIAEAYLQAFPCASLRPKSTFAIFMRLLEERHPLD